MTTDRAGAVSSAPAVATIASAAAPPATAATAGAAIGLEHAARPRSRYAASRVAALATAASLSAGRPAATAFHFPGRSRRPSLSRSKPGLVATTDHALQVRASAQNAEPAAGRLAGLAHLAFIVSANRAVPAPRPEAWLTDQATARPEQLAWLKNPPGLPALGPARWAVQVLAGPSLTYRQLSSAGQPNSPSPPSGPAAGYNYAILPNPDVTSLERPALAGGGEVSLRRNLNQTWSITAGLGYVEYATRLALQLVKPAATSYQLPAVDSTLTSIHRRDTYHFVTVPVRVGYSWAITPRWRAGVLAGADVALYVGGRTTEGSACACQSQTWGLSDSPYRRLSLGLSLGAEARYRINGRWELLAQPTLSYLVTPLGSSSAASSTIALARTYTQRYPFGGALLLGAAYDLP